LSKFKAPSRDLNGVEVVATTATTTTTTNMFSLELTTSLY